MCQGPHQWPCCRNAGLKAITWRQFLGMSSQCSSLQTGPCSSILEEPEEAHRRFLGTICRRASSGSTQASWRRKSRNLVPNDETLQLADIMFNSFGALLQKLQKQYPILKAQFQPGGSEPTPGAWRHCSDIYTELRRPCAEPASGRACSATSCSLGRVSVVGPRAQGMLLPSNTSP